jgi:hypothetical protein
MTDFTPREAADLVERAGPMWLVDDNDRASTALRVLIDHARATSPAPEGGDLTWLVDGLTRIASDLEEANESLDDERVAEEARSAVSAIEGLRSEVKVHMRRPAPSVAAPPREDVRDPGHAFTTDGFLDQSELTRRFEQQLRRIVAVHPGDVFERNDGGVNALVDAGDLARTYARVARIAFYGNDEVDASDAMHTEPAAAPEGGDLAADDWRRFSTSQVRGALGWWLYAAETGDHSGGTEDAARDVIGHEDADRLARLLPLRPTPSVATPPREGECLCSDPWDPAAHMHRFEAHPECPQHGDPAVLAQIAPAVGDMVETVEQLDGLPVGAVVRTGADMVAERIAHAWRLTGAAGEYRTTGLTLPARVLDVPEGSK